MVLAVSGGRVSQKDSGWEFFLEKNNEGHGNMGEKGNGTVLDRERGVA